MAQPLRPDISSRKSQAADRRPGLCPGLRGTVRSGARLARQHPAIRTHRARPAFAQAARWILRSLFERAEIEEGALDGCADVLAYAADPVEFFFLQIQGSGRLRLDNGEVMRIGYAGQNGRGIYRDWRSNARARIAWRWSWAISRVHAGHHGLYSREPA